MRGIMKKIPLLLLLLLLPSFLVACAARPLRPDANRVGSSTGGARRATLANANGFFLTSPAVEDGGALPVKYTCDGESATLPLSWRNVPTGTVEFAVVMHHVPGPGDTHWYWVLYNIPAAITSLPETVTSVGVLGTNSVNDRTEYAPPCSKGPGPKEYIYTVYALSSPPALAVPPAQVSRDVLLTAIDGRVLGSAEMAVIYSR